MHLSKNVKKYIKIQWQLFYDYIIEKGYHAQVKNKKYSQ